MTLTIGLLPKVQILGPVTNSSSEMFVCVTKQAPPVILEDIKRLSNYWLKENPEKYHYDYKCELDEEHLIVLKGGEAFLWLFDNIAEYLAAPEWVYPMDEEDREFQARHKDTMNRMPELTQIMIKALTDLPYDVITKHNLGALPFSCPFIKPYNWDEGESLYDEYEAGKYTREEYNSIRKAREAIREQDNRERLTTWCAQNKTALDILLPNVVIFRSADDNSVGGEIIDHIIMQYNGSAIHLG